MKIKARLLIDIETDLSDDPENTEETLRFLVEEDLIDMGYEVESCKIFKDELSKN
jgi:hypothetical protein